MSSYNFKPRAQLLLQLGEQLIKNESVALIELIKNSYDADATNVSVVMNDINSPLLGEIRIKDNGFGMDREVIEKIWLEPGNTHKKSMIDQGQKTPKGRLPIGEKGIGRFGVHKLGSHITLITRAENNAEIVVELDWDAFIDAKYLGDVSINIIERKPEIFINNQAGTLIIIKKLRQVWTQNSYKQICRAISNLNSPFNYKDDFHVDIECNLAGWNSNIVTFESIKKYSLFHFVATIGELGTIDWEYQFTPFKQMGQISGRTKKEKEIATDGKHVEIVSKNEKGYPISKIGKFTFEVYAFDRDSEIINRFVIDDKKSFKSYLDENGGIYVFRDGMRIYDYGEKGNDWLQLDIGRVNSPGEKLSNNLIIGSVQLKREESTDLVEKANREGFIENPAYETFKRLLLRSIEIFSQERNIDKNEYRSKKAINEPLTGEIQILAQKIEQSSATDPEKNEMQKYLNIIDKEYAYIKDITLTTASAGLSYGVVIHEIEKIVKEIVEETLQGVSIQEMREKIMHLSDTIENYGNLLRERKKVKGSLLEISKRARSNCAYRFKAHKIECKINDKTFVNDGIECTYNLIVSSVMNLFDNSIWWIDNAKNKNKKISLYFSNYLNGYKTLIIVDNGTGFSLRPEDAIKPFVSKKPGGMGIGLNIVNEIMITHDSMLVFPHREDLVDLDLSQEDVGAIVGLAFKK